MTFFTKYLFTIFIISSITIISLTNSLISEKQLVSAQQSNSNDLDNNGSVGLSDVIIIVRYIFDSLTQIPNSNGNPDINLDSAVNLLDAIRLIEILFEPQISPSPTIIATPDTTPTPTHSMNNNEAMSYNLWDYNKSNSPDLKYDKCDDGTDIVHAHKAYYVIAYDGLKYPTWHPPVVTNPVTGNGKCYFGHEHGSNPSKYLYYDDMAKHFGKDLNGDGVITKMVVSDSGVVTAGDRAGIPFGLANEKMDMYYNQEGRDSLFVRHEDHVGHKIEFVNNESEMVGNTTHPMNQLPGTIGINIPYGSSNNYQPTGVVCTHLHKFHQGTHSADALRNNMHEVIFHSKCMSVNVGNINAKNLYPDNTVLLTGMMTFGNPAEYLRFCGEDRFTKICADGKDSSGKCIITDPLISKLPNSVYSNTLGRNMVDKYCLQNIDRLTNSFYFTPYEIWEGDLRITTPSGKMLAEHGKQWDVLDPIRYIDTSISKGFGYNSEQCGPGGLLYRRTLLCEVATGEYGNTPWNSPQSGFRGLKRTTYFGRNRVSNQGGVTTWYTDPLGGNAVTTFFESGLKQMFSSVEADICKLPVCTTLNDRALQRQFNDGGGTVHAPN